MSIQDEELCVYLMVEGIYDLSELSDSPVVIVLLGYLLQRLELREQVGRIYVDLISDKYLLVLGLFAPITIFLIRADFKEECSDDISDSYRL